MKSIKWPATPAFTALSLALAVSVVHAAPSDGQTPAAIDSDYPVKTMGDVNQDAVPDIAVGDPQQRQIFVISGTDGSVISTIKGGEAGLSAASIASFAVVNDVNDDAAADVLVRESEKLGRFSIYSGADGTKLSSMDRRTGLNANIRPLAFGGLGRNSADASVGDFNGDGVFEIALPDAVHGKLLVVDGKSGKVHRALDLPQWQANAAAPAADAGVAGFGYCQLLQAQVRSGDWRTLASFWHASLTHGYFQLPAGASIRLLRGSGWISWETQKQKLDGINVKHLQADESYIPSRMQMKVPRTTAVTFTLCPEGGLPPNE